MLRSCPCSHSTGVSSLILRASSAPSRRSPRLRERACRPRPRCSRIAVERVLGVVVHAALDAPRQLSVIGLAIAFVHQFLDGHVLRSIAGCPSPAGEFYGPPCGWCALPLSARICRVSGDGFPHDERTKTACDLREYRPETPGRLSAMLDIASLLCFITMRDLRASAYACVSSRCWSILASFCGWDGSR